MLTRATPWGMVMKQGAGVPYMDSRSKTGIANIDDPAFWALADKMGTSDSNDYTSLVADVQRYYAENIPAIQCIGINLFKHITVIFIILPLTEPLGC